jgi:hypothetical protein
LFTESLVIHLSVALQNTFMQYAIAGDFSR